MEARYSLKEYASDKKRMAFVCTCKKCGTAITDYVSPDVWLDIAYVLVDSDFLTLKEFKNLHHLAVTQWDDIDKIYFHGYELKKGAN